MASKTQEIIANTIMPGCVEHGESLVTFAIYSPGKSSVHLIGSFNNWDRNAEPLEQLQPGYWVTAIHLDKGAHEYQFVIDNNLVICDPYARQVKTAPGQEPKAYFEIGEEAHHWQHDDWMRRGLQDLIIYEMHIGDFTPEGTFLAAEEKLDHVKELGISAIELMPINECDPDDYWGYKPNYMMAPRQAYGTPEDFCRLVDAAHHRNIAVLLDLVLTHTGHQHPFNRMYPYHQSPWYGPGVGEPNQFALPTLDYSKDPTYAFAKDVQAYWLENYHVDGFRYDYIAGIGSDQQGRGLPGLMTLARAIQPDAFFIGECIPENPQLVNNSGLNAVWYARSRMAIQALLLENDNPAYSWSRFGEAVWAFDPTKQGYNEASFVINYAESHDDLRVMLGLRQRGFNENTIEKKAKLAAILLMMIPGEPMIYQGQEWGESLEKSLQANKINWSAAQSGLTEKVLETYKSACKLRRSRASARRGNFSMPLVDEQKRCIVFHRSFGESDQVVVAVNFSDQKQTIPIKIPRAGSWRQFPSQDFIELPEQIERQLDEYSALIFLTGRS